MYDWRDYLEISKEFLSSCIAQPPNRLRKETMLRTAISRAYYAAFHRSNDYLKTYGFRPNEQSVHRSVIEKIDSYVHNGEVKISSDLDRAFVSRKKADYNDSLTGLEKEAEITIERAKTIIKEIDTRKAGPY